LPIDDGKKIFGRDAEIKSADKMVDDYAKISKYTADFYTLMTKSDNQDVISKVNHQYESVHASSYDKKASDNR